MDPYTVYGNEQGSATLGGKKGNLPGAKTLNFTGSFLGRICSLFLLEVAVLDPEKSPSAILPKKGLGSVRIRRGSGKLSFGIYFIPVFPTGFEPPLADQSPNL